MRYLLWLVGALEALLLARLVLRLLAARPENPVFAAFFWVTSWLRWPFAALDASQPRFGAVLELSTLAACVLGLALVVALAFASRTRKRSLS